MMLSSSSMEMLNHFYNRFKNRIIDSRIKIERKSLLFTIIKLPVNQLSRLLTDSTINSTSFSLTELESLSSSGYIRSLDELGKSYDYAITVKGIWCVELNKNEMNIDRLLDYFQENKLSFKITNKPLKDIEKIILWAMIAIRNFSSACPMDTKSRYFCDSWVEIFDSCTKYLHEIGAVNKDKWSTFQSGNEHPISYVMRHANDLPQKTIHIYQNLGSNKYFLDVDNGNAPPQKQLLFLFKLILGKLETKDQIDEIYSFFCDIAYDKSKNVNDKLKYISPEWDTILKEALKDLYYES